MCLTLTKYLNFEVKKKRQGAYASEIRSATGACPFSFDSLHITIQGHKSYPVRRKLLVYFQFDFLYYNIMYVVS